MADDNRISSSRARTAVMPLAAECDDVGVTGREWLWYAAWLVIRDRHSWRAHVRRARTACRSCRHDRARQEPEVTARTTWCARGCVAPAPLHRVPQSRRAGRCVLPECSRRILHTGVEPVAIPLSGCGARRGQRALGPATEESHEYRLTARQICLGLRGSTQQPSSIGSSIGS